jgi:hypothetical protein
MQIHGTTVIRARTVVALSLAFQLLYALLLWGLTVPSGYPFILLLLPGLALMWVLLQPSFLLGAVVIAAINTGFHLAVFGLWRLIRRGGDGTRRGSIT